MGCGGMSGNSARTCGANCGTAFSDDGNKGCGFGADEAGIDANGAECEDVVMVAPGFGDAEGLNGGD